MNYKKLKNIEFITKNIVFFYFIFVAFTVGSRYFWQSVKPHNKLIANNNYNNNNIKNKLKYFNRMWGIS